MHAAGHFPQMGQSLITDLLPHHFAVPRKHFPPFHGDERVDLPSLLTFFMPFGAREHGSFGVSDKFTPFGKRRTPVRLTNECEFLFVAQVDQRKHGILPQRQFRIRIHMRHQSFHSDNVFFPYILVKKQFEFRIASLRPGPSSRFMETMIPHCINLHVNPVLFTFRDEPVPAVKFRTETRDSVFNGDHVKIMESNHIAAVPLHLLNNGGYPGFVFPICRCDQLRFAVIMAAVTIFTACSKFHGKETEWFLRFAFPGDPSMPIDNDPFDRTTIQTGEIQSGPRNDLRSRRTAQGSETIPFPDNEFLIYRKRIVHTGKSDSGNDPNNIGIFDAFQPDLMNLPQKRRKFEAADIKSVAPPGTIVPCRADQSVCNGRRIPLIPHIASKFRTDRIFAPGAFQTDRPGKSGTGCPACGMQKIKDFRFLCRNGNHGIPQTIPEMQRPKSQN